MEASSTEVQLQLCVQPTGTEHILYSKHCAKMRSKDAKMKKAQSLVSIISLTKGIDGVSGRYKA